MFSGVWRSPTFTWVRVRITADEREFPLDANREVEPLDQSRLPKSMKQMLDKENSRSLVQAALFSTASSAKTSCQRDVLDCTVPADRMMR